MHMIWQEPRSRAQSVQPIDLVQLYIAQRSQSVLTTKNVYLAPSLTDSMDTKE